FDLSAMTAAEGVRLIEESEGKACVRFYRRTDGRIVTCDCLSARAVIQLRRVVTRFVGAAASLVAFALCMAGCGGDERKSSSWNADFWGRPAKNDVLQGKVCVPARGESQPTMGGIAVGGNDDGQIKADDDR